jgi:hypothetical protein
VPDNIRSESLTSKVEEFLLELFDTLNRTIPGIPNDLFHVIVDARGRNVAIRQTTREGITLCVESTPVLYLGVSFRCTWSADESFLAIEESTFELSTKDSPEPLLRYDYLRSPTGHIPGAHINVHAHRDEMVFAMVAAGAQDRGALRHRAMDSGKMPRLANLHLPVGGHRFRPSLEDILEFAIAEFGVDCLPSHRTALDEGRVRYRTRQLMAAVADDPESAAEELRRIGYTVEAGNPSRSPRTDRTRAW